MNGSLESNTTPANALTAGPSIGKRPENRARKDLTQEEVRKHLNYNPETGGLRWKSPKGGRSKSGIVGGFNSSGYLRLKFNRKEYAAHRIIWLWWYGYFPEGPIDHIDRDRSNNKLCNLREVSPQCNSRNCKIQERNISGVKGVCFIKARNKWCADIMDGGKEIFLCLHEDFTEAVAHRLAAEQCLDWAGCDSSSSAYQYMQKYLQG